MRVRVKFRGPGSSKRAAAAGVRSALHCASSATRTPTRQRWSAAAASRAMSCTFHGRRVHSAAAEPAEKLHRAPQRGMPRPSRPESMARAMNRHGRPAEDAHCATAARAINHLPDELGRGEKKPADSSRAGFRPTAQARLAALIGGCRRRRPRRCRVRQPELPLPASEGR